MTRFAIAGRALDDSDGKLSIMAVGEMTEHLRFFGRNVEFIRKFQRTTRRRWFNSWKTTGPPSTSSTFHHLIPANVATDEVDHRSASTGERSPTFREQVETVDPVSKGRVPGGRRLQTCTKPQCVKSDWKPERAFASLDGTTARFWRGAGRIWHRSVPCWRRPGFP